MYELQEAFEKSLERRRTIDIQFDAPSERSVFKSQMAALGGEVIGSASPDEFGKFIQSDLQGWAELIKSRDIKSDE